MAIILPNPTDTLLSDNHALMHQVYAIDSAAPQKSVIVSGTGNVSVGGYLGTNPFFVSGTGSLGLTYQVGISNPAVTPDLSLGVSASGGEIQTQGGVPLYLNYNGPNVVLLQQGTGSVCIGSGTSPAATLDVYGDIVGSGQTWSNYSATSHIVGINPTVNKWIYTKKIGKTVLVDYDLYGVTSGSSVTFGVPFIPAANPSNYFFPTVAFTIAGGTASGMATMLASATTVTCYPSPSTSVWASGTASTQGQFFYQSV